MTPKTFKAYHFFIVLSIINFLTFYLFVGQSVLDIHKKEAYFFGDEMFNYFFSISVALVGLWLTYHFFHKRLISKRLIWLHLFSASVTVFIIPLLLSKFLNPMPRRYYDYDNRFDLSKFFGGMTWTFLIVFFLLVISEIFLFINLERQNRVKNA